MNRVWLVVALTMLVACGDHVAPPPGGLSAAESAGPTDPNMNPDDTWIVFDGTVAKVDTIESSEPVFDPQTGETTSTLVVSSGMDTLYSIEGGYDFDGILRMRMTGRWTPTDPTLTAVTDAFTLVISQDVLYQYDVNGNLLTAPPFPDSISQESPLSLLGADLLYGSITDGVLVDSLRADQSVSASLVASEAPPSLGFGAGTQIFRRVGQRDGREVLEEIVLRQVSETSGCVA